MISPKAFIEDLKHQGFKITLNDSGRKIVVRSDGISLTDEQRKLIRENKLALLDVLQLQILPQIVSKWEKPRRLDFAGAVGRNRSAGRDMNEAFQAAFLELRDFPSQN